MERKAISKISLVEYHLAGSSFEQKEIGQRIADSFSLKAADIKKDGDKLSFDVLVEVSGASFSGSFNFHCSFAVRDEKWYEDSEKEEKNSTIYPAFSVVFPFIRQTIFSMTNDFLGNIFIPVIDPCSIDLIGGTSFTRQQHPGEKAEELPKP